MTDPIHALAFGEPVALQPGALPNNGERSGRTTPDNPATSGDTADNSLRERIAEAARPWLLGADEADVQHCAAILGVVVERDMRVLADEVTRLSAVTGQLRALATRWQATVRPGEAHPAAAAILTILDGDGPSVQDCAAADRAWFDGEKAGG